MEVKNNEVVEFSLKEICLVVLHKCWIIVLIGSLFAAAAGFMSMYLITPIYTSTTSVYIINRDDDNRLTFQDLQTGTQLTKDYMILVKSRPVAEQVIKELGLDLTYETLVGMIDAETPEDTRILKIIVNYNNAGMAKKIADAFARISAERMVSVMELEKVNVLEDANLPSSPSSPDLKRNIILGALIGIAFSTIIIIFRYLLNDSIKSSEDIEKYLGVTTLSCIPFEDINDRRKKRNRNDTKQSRRKSALAS